MCSAVPQQADIHANEWKVGFVPLPEAAHGAVWAPVQPGKTDLPLCRKMEQGTRVRSIRNFRKLRGQTLCNVRELTIPESLLRVHFLLTVTARLEWLRLTHRMSLDHWH
jgi:hypothetical protein